MKRGDSINLNEKIKACLPQGVINKAKIYDQIEEIRLRTNSPLCFTVKGKSLVTDYTVTKSDMDYSLSRLCKNSLYTYIDCIKNGYLPFDDGYRVGVCGTAITENNSIKNITDITSLNIRIPSTNIKLPTDILNELPFTKGVMVYSAANGGKTTFLKHIAAHLAKPPHNKRVAVLDPKKELYSNDLHKSLPIDFFVGYPKYQAMDMAVRNMAPDVIICDEIGIDDEISSFIECKNCGVGIICSAHAFTIQELLSREKIKKLHDKMIFEGYVGISAENGIRKYRYTKRKDIAP